MSTQLCACGCGNPLPEYIGNGRRGQYYSGACRVRAYRSKSKTPVTKPRNEIEAIPQGTVVKPIMRYPGAKWTRASWIIEHFPPFRTYVEPFFGSGAVFFSLPKPPEYAVLNDKSRAVVNLFQMIRTRGPELCALIEMTPWARDEYDNSFLQSGDPLEDARRFLVRCWQAHGTRLNTKTGWRNRGSADGGLTYSLWNRVPDRVLAIIEKLKYAEIENRDALDVLTRFADQEDCLVYADPPYLISTRSGAMYEHEMIDKKEHETLLDALDKHAGPVVLSGYAHALYDQRLSHWRRVSMSSLAEKGQVRSEVLWLNAKVPTVVQQSLFV